MGLNPKKAAELSDILMVIRISGKFFNPFIEPLNLCYLFLIGCHVLVQGFTVQLGKIKFFQPVQVFEGKLLNIWYLAFCSFGSYNGSQ